MYSSRLILSELWGAYENSLNIVAAMGVLYFHIVIYIIIRVMGIL